MKFKYLALAVLPLALAACQSGDIQKLGDTAVKVLQQQGNAEQTLNAYQWSLSTQQIPSNPSYLTLQTNV